MLNVGGENWFFMPAELGPGELLDCFFERADAARQRDEGVRTLEHDPFALVHVLGDDYFLRLLQHALTCDQKFRDHASDFAAVLEHRFGELTHEPDGAA